ncbi:MAG: TAT-variant-translocated molybdopterin oxidoreductase [Isosphaeraceae bacterium]
MHSNGEPVLVQIGPLPAAPKGPKPKKMWRSLDELAGSEEFFELLQDEFPSQASELTDPASRRTFLKFMGASLGLAGVSGCVVQPAEMIVPYVKQPEELVPGKPLYFASAAPLGGYGVGVLVESHMGRPTKIEGNPAHPASLGGTDAFAQAEVLALYDPDRSQVVLHNGRVSTWDDFLAVITKARAERLAKKGAGLRILTETITSPTLAHQLRQILKTFPEAKWHVFDPVSRDHARAGAVLAFGEDVEPIHHLDKADVVLALDADFLSWGPARLKDARQFTSRRESVDGPGVNRLYVAEACPTITGAMADQRLPVSASRIAEIARAVAHGLGVEGVSPVGSNPDAAWIKAVVDDLKSHQGAALVLVGETQSAEVHALGHAINHTLGNVGKTIEYLPPIEERPGDGEGGTLLDLVEAMDRDEVESLLILGGNPVYAAPADIDFAKRLDKVPLSVHLSLHEDETTVHCHWHIPEAHFLETWGDIRAFDSSATIQQPLIAPLYGGKAAVELLEVVLNGSTKSARGIVTAFWKDSKGKDQSDSDFDTFWRETLRIGLVADTASKVREVTLKGVANLEWPQGGSGGIEILFRPDPTIWDGRFANSGWLQELPKPLTKLSWDNAALLSQRTADRLGVKAMGLHGESDMVSVVYQDRAIQLPAWIMPGHADESVTIHLGYGRLRGGTVGTGSGANAYALRTSVTPWIGVGAKVFNTGESYCLATMQHQQTMLGRNLVRTATVEEFRDHPKFAQEPDEHLSREMTLWENPDPQLRRQQGEGNAWGMTINLNTCIGCNACVVACQAENNIPVVGREQVLAGRNMHWIRIDRYFEGNDTVNPRIYHQPVPCMHCENAPCELVCPVAATTHSAEGLNEMTYNRCVGTRYCGNNCPYKVRRFNFFEYADHKTPSLKLLNNPDVTVRSRGVMEKCTYCVQRINSARIASEMEGRTRVGGNEVETACQGVCPTRAISFGNMNDPEGDVAKLKKSPRNYALLAELNTRPRTTYLAKLTNPNPEMKAE